MKLFVGPTDHDWYTYLRNQQRDEANFWWPSGHQAFRALEPGEPFLFKAKAPHEAIIGGGFFVSYVSAPVSLAWQAFGEANGTPDARTLLERLRKYRRDDAPDPEIGCTILSEPFFFPEELWVNLPPDWKKNIVRGKTYSTDEPIGANLWDAVVRQMADPRTITGPSIQDATAAGPAVDGKVNMFGAASPVRHRLGQGAFRLGVLDAYGKRCAVTGERVVPVLEAAHIRPYTSEGPHLISNGLALRADIHRLFDLGYVTVDRNLKFRVSRLLEEEYANGKDYYRYQNAPLAVTPQQHDKRPAAEYLEWHGDVVFRP